MSDPTSFATLKEFWDDFYTSIGGAEVGEAGQLIRLSFTAGALAITTLREKQAASPDPGSAKLSLDREMSKFLLESMSPEGAISLIISLIKAQGE